MNLIQVDSERCIQCGQCSEVCPMGTIKMGNEGPEETGQGCIACGHCVAICPREALDNVKAPLVNQVSLAEVPVLDAEQAEKFLRRRRSIRSYQQKRIPREKIQELLAIARLAPTGGNSQGVAYQVIDNAEILKKITEKTIEWMEEEIKKASPWASYIKGTVMAYRSANYDSILRSAPCLVIAIADKSFMPRGRDNTHFSLAYAELYAPTIELGTCWAGFFEACAASGYQPLLELLQLPENKVVTGGIMVGYPKYTYKRLVDRNPLQITWM